MIQYAIGFLFFSSSPIFLLFLSSVFCKKLLINYLLQFLKIHIYIQSIVYFLFQFISCMVCTKSTWVPRLKTVYLISSILTTMPKPQLPLSPQKSSMCFKHSLLSPLTWPFSSFSDSLISFMFTLFLLILCYSKLSHTILPATSKGISKPHPKVTGPSKLICGYFLK